MNPVLKWLAGAAVLAVVPSPFRPACASPLGPGADAATGTAQSVVVTAQKTPVQTLIDRKVYSIASDLQSTSGTAADVLNELPSVEVDADGNVSLRGDSNVTILIDGKPSAQLSGAAAGDGLLQFPASDIDRIEVITNPPAQFKADGSGGVINIITKKTRKAGPSGTEQISLGNNRRYVLGAGGNFNTGQLDLSGGLGLRQDDKQRIVTSHRAATDPISTELVLSHQDIEEHLRRLTPSLKAGGITA